MSLQLVLNAVFMVAVAVASSVSAANDDVMLGNLVYGTDEPIFLKVAPRLEPTTNRAGLSMNSEFAKSITLETPKGERIARKSFFVTLDTGYRTVCDLEMYSLFGRQVSISSNESFQLANASVTDAGGMELSFRSPVMSPSIYKPSLTVRCPSANISVASFVGSLRDNGLEVGTAQAINTHSSDISSTAMAIRRPQLKRGPQN